MLVATSVIEVGIDVPNATVMLIEAAERYGLSQLHQLRGRVGRGEHASLCILFGDPTLPRLEAIARERDGFRLAEVDLELRGAGDVLGTRQHGLPEFRVARLPEDVELLVRARDRADQILIDDPRLEQPEHALLREAVVARFGSELDPIPGMTEIWKRSIACTRSCWREGDLDARARGSARRLRVGRAGPSGRGGPPRRRRRHRSSSATGSSRGRTPDRSGELELTRPDTVLALGHRHAVADGPAACRRDELRPGLDVSRRRAGAAWCSTGTPTRGRRAAEPAS